jgi:hypothetical protein
LESISTFFKYQEPFLGWDLAAAFFRRRQEQAATAGLLAEMHFTVDGALIEAWASLKSFRPHCTPPPLGGGVHNPEEHMRRKTVGNLRQPRPGAEDKVDWMFTFIAAVFNPVRIRNRAAGDSP